MAGPVSWEVAAGAACPTSAGQALEAPAEEGAKGVCMFACVCICVHVCVHVCACTLF